MEPVNATWRCWRGPPRHAAAHAILMQFAAEHIGSYYGAFASDHRVLVEANLRCAEEFGIDQLSAISDPYGRRRVRRADRVPRNGVPICLKPPLEEDPDLARLSRPDPLKAPRMRDRVDAVSAYKARAGGRYSIMGWVEDPRPRRPTCAGFPISSSICSTTRPMRAR